MEAISNALVRSIAIYALKDSSAWKGESRVAEETIALVASFPAVLSFSATMGLSLLFSDAEWLGRYKIAILAAFVVWYLVWLSLSRKWVKARSVDIDQEMSRLSSLPAARWKRIQALSTFLAWLVMFLSIVAMLVLVAYLRAERGTG